MKALFTLLVAIVSMNIMAQTVAPGKRSARMSRKYQIIVELDKPNVVNSHNKELKRATDNSQALAKMANTANPTEKSEFLNAVAKGFGTALVQKTQNASSNLSSVLISYGVEAMKSKKQRWYSLAQAHCTLNRKLKSDIAIQDFYSAPSSLGAMDPQNIQFKGFGCHHYLEEQGSPMLGEEVFYIFCSMRRDSVGISSIVNHSKFLVEVDSIYFNPKHCGLPNDSLDSLTPFDFSKRSDLTLNINARIYSSWINEAIMVTNDQKLGEFSITARIDPSLLNSDSVFIYRKNDPRMAKSVTITGDSYIVPRSFTGTANGTTYSSTWGTGQYRIEMDINESCSIVNEYYYKEKYRNEQVNVPQYGNGQNIAFANIPELKKFDKAKWEVEWTPIKSRQRKAPLWSSAWKGIVTAYRGTSWIQTFSDPLVSVLINYEGQKLNDLFELSAASGSGSAAKASASSPNSGAPTGAPAGGMPQGKK